MDAPISLAFPWDIFQVVLDGVSILDVPKLEIQSMEEATNFVAAYGYDPNRKEDLDLIWGFFGDAVDFIDKSLVDPEFPSVPEHLRNREVVKDIRRLLLLASEDEMSADRMWACALLRVMHVLIHINHDPRLKYFEQVQNQILSRLDSYLYVDETDGTTYLGKKDREDRIKLLFFKKKDRKDRVREIVKLFHKSSATAEEIYDRIGFRLVTETKFDAIRAVRLLLNNNIISLPNIRPGRSRNWLIDIERFKAEIRKLETYCSKANEQDKFEEGFFKLTKKLERRIQRRISKEKGSVNPHSSSYYHAIQFTCRELVKVRNPAYHTYNRIKSQLENLHGGQQILNEVFPSPLSPYKYLFFPYEIQIMDVKSYADSIFGKSSHEEYRRKQLDSARNRIFGRKN